MQAHRTRYKNVYVNIHKQEDIVATRGWHRIKTTSITVDIQANFSQVSIYPELRITRPCGVRNMVDLY